MLKKKKVFLAAFAALAIGATAWSAPSPASEQARLADNDREHGRTLLGKLPGEKSNSARLDTIDQALVVLRRARDEASRSADADLQRLVVGDLVSAIDDKAEIYYKRGSFHMAAKQAREALKLVPGDPRATNLLMASGGQPDIYDELGTAATNRIRDRRLGAGMSLRDRGSALRR